MTSRFLSQNFLPAYSGGVRSEFHILVHNVSRLLGTLFDRSFKPLNITRAQWWTLRVLAASRDDEINQTELAALLSSTKASLGKLLVKMEAAGLVARAPDPGDQRAFYVTTLPNGKALLKELEAIEQQLSVQIHGSISQEDMEATGKILRQAKSNMQRHSGTTSVIQTTQVIKTLESSSGRSDPNWLGFLIHDVARIRQSIMDRLLSPLDMTRSQWWVLSYLMQQDGMTQTALAKELELSRAALGGLISKLEESQLIAKHPDPEDMRRNRILLTKAGAGLVRSIRNSTSESEDFVLSNIDEEQIRNTVQTLNHLKDNITELLQLKK